MKVSLKISDRQRGRRAAKMTWDKRADVETVEFNAQTKLQANRRAPTPTDIFEAERALSAFDCSTSVDRGVLNLSKFFSLNLSKF